MLSIIIPTKNEPYINRLIKEINKKVKARYEIIVVDKSDFSFKLPGAKVLRQRSDGLANAVLEGVKIAKGEYIVFMDGDGSHDPKYINDMLKFVLQYDIVIGSRYVKGGSSDDSFTRILISKVLNKTTAAFLGLEIKDIMSGYALAKAKLLRNPKLKPKGYKILLELVGRSKAKTKEIPIVFYKRKAGSSKVGFNFSGLKEMLRILSIAVKLKIGN